MSTPENPPAFPVAYEHNEATAEYHGMTLRDYFAAKALQGLIAHHGDSGWHPEAGIQSTLQAADLCYQYADSMLAARNRAGEEGRS